MRKRSEEDDAVVLRRSNFDEGIRVVMEGEDVGGATSSVYNLTLKLVLAVVNRDMNSFGCYMLDKLSQ